MQMPLRLLVAISPELLDHYFILSVKKYYTSPYDFV